MKNFLIQKFFWPETSSQYREAEMSRNAVNAKILSAHPELVHLNNLPQEQLEARAAILSTLKDFINNPSKLEKWNFFPWYVRTGAMEHMKILREMLSKNYKESDWKRTVETYIHRLELDGTINLEINKTEMSWGKLLQRLGGNVGVIFQTPENSREAENVALTEDQITKKTRLSAFLLAIEVSKRDQLQDKDFIGNNGKVTLEAAIRHTRELLTRNKIDDAINYFNKAIDGQWKQISVLKAIESEEALAHAERTLWATDGSRHISEWYKQLNERQQAEGQHPILQRISGRIEKIDQGMLDRADVMYRDILAKFPAGHPELIKMEENPQAYKDILVFNLILKEETDQYIADNGADNLPTVLKDYKDMMGIGWFDLSDTSIKVIKEWLIIVASIALTFATAWLASVATTGLAARLAISANKVNAIANATRIVQTTRIGRATISTGKTLGHAFPSALTFTVSDTVLRQIGLWSDGDRQLWADVGRSFSNFTENLAKNTAMFAAFAGMERFIGGTYSKVFANITPSTKIGHITLEGGRIASLTAGDIAAIHLMHAAETGKFEAGWEMIFVALAFRVGFKTVEQYFPNTAKTFSQKNPEEQVQILDDVVKQGIQPADKHIADEIARIRNLWPQNTRTISNEQMVTRQEILTKLQNPRKGDVIELPNGTKWEYTGNNHRWINSERKYATSQEIRSDLIMQTRPNTQIQNQIDLLTGVNNRSPKMRERDFLTEWDVALINALKNPQSRIITTPDGAEWRYTGRNWQKLEPGKTWATMDYLQGVQKTADELIDQYVRTRYARTNRQNSHSRNPLEWSQRLVFSDEVEAFFRTQRIRDIDDFHAKHQILRTRQEELTANLAKDPGNINIKGDLLQVETALEKFDNIAQKIKQNIFEPSKTRFNAPQEAIDGINTITPNLGNELQIAVNEAKNGNVEKMRNFFHNHWQSISNGIIGTRFLPYFINSQKINPFAVLPSKLSDDPEEAMEQCLQCIVINGRSEIDFSRKNGNILLDENRRINISKRWLKTKDWGDLMIKWNRLMLIISQSEPENARFLQEKMEAMIQNPTVQRVQDFQWCVGMAAEDTPLAQDGILGRNTTKAILTFIEKCYNTYTRHTERVSDNREVTSSSNQVEGVPWRTPEILAESYSAANIRRVEILTPSEGSSQNLPWN